MSWYPAWWTFTFCELERSTIFHGKIHYLNGNFPLQTVSSPEGSISMKNARVEDVEECWGKNKMELGMSQVIATLWASKMDTNMGYDLTQMWVPKELKHHVDRIPNFQAIARHMAWARGGVGGPEWLGFQLLPGFIQLQSCAAPWGTTNHRAVLSWSGG